MDILASIFAYLVSLAGILGALAISFFVFFSPPAALKPAPAQTEATALLVSPTVSSATPSAATKRSLAADKHAKAGSAKPRPSPVTTIAVDRRQKGRTPQVQSRLLSERERARHLAYREGADFETRFLHKDD